VGNLLAELVDLTGIGVSSSDICALPADPVDPIADIITENIVTFDFSKTQMGIVDTDKDNALSGGGFDDLNPQPIVVLSLLE